MIKVIKIGIGGISKKIWLNIFLLVEVIVIIVASNVIVCNMNSKEILYEPFKYLMNKQGFVYATDPVLEDDTDDTLKVLKKMEKKLKGDFSVHRVYTRTSLLKLNANRSLDVDVNGFETEFCKNINIPLSEGSWDITSEDGEYVECVICPNRFGVGVGSLLTEKNNGYGETLTYKVVGVLANPTYFPKSNYMSSGCNTFFESYDMNNETIDSPNLFMYVNGRKLSEYSGTSVGYGEFITYNKTVGADIIRYNNKVLDTKGFYYSIKEFKKNSEDYVLKMQRRFMPAFIGVMFVVMIGIISASMIQTMSQMRQYGVFYLCGASRSKCILMSIIGNILTYVISVVVSFCIVVTVYNTELRTKIGMVMEINNIWITLFIMVVLVAMSIVVPFVMLKVKSIKEILIKHEE